MPDDYESIWMKIIFRWTPSPWLYFIVPLNLQLDLKRNKLWEAIWPCAPTQWISLHQPLSIMLMFLLYLNFNLVLVDVQFSIMLIYANTFPWTWSFITGIRMSRDLTCFKTASSSLSRSCLSSRSSSPSENKGWGLLSYCGLRTVFFWFSFVILPPPHHHHCRHRHPHHHHHKNIRQQVKHHHQQAEYMEQSSCVGGVW